MAVANENIAQGARSRHQAHWTKVLARYSSHSVQLKPVEKQSEPEAPQIDTDDYCLPESYQGPVKPPQRQRPATYPQSLKQYHHHRPFWTHRPSLGPVRHHKTRYRQEEKRWSDIGTEQAAPSLHNARSNNNAASPVRYPVLTDAAAELCVYFTSKGFCVDGAACPRTHDVQRMALCPSVLTVGVSCKPRIDTCKLQHSPGPETLPTCFYFLNGQCSRSSCAYSHSPVDSHVLVCPDFGLLGYCARGSGCRMSHLRWCPDFSNAGEC